MSLRVEMRVDGTVDKRWDLPTNTFTQYASDGTTVVSTRPLTAAEAAELTPVPDPNAARQALRDAIAAAESPAELQALLLQAIDQGIV